MNDKLERMWEAAVAVGIYLKGLKK